MTHPPAREEDWCRSGEGVLLQHLWSKGRFTKAVQGAGTDHPIRHWSIEWVSWDPSRRSGEGASNHLLLVPPHLPRLWGHCSQAMHPSDSYWTPRELHGRFSGRTLPPWPRPRTCFLTSTSLLPPTPQTLMWSGLAWYMGSWWRCTWMWATWFLNRLHRLPSPIRPDSASLHWLPLYATLKESILTLWHTTPSARWLIWPTSRRITEIRKILPFIWGQSNI